MGFPYDVRDLATRALLGVRTALGPVLRNPRLWALVRDVAEQAWWTTYPVVRRHTSGEGRWLDVGCADGQLAHLFPSERYVGLDLDADRIAYARSRHPGHRFVVADATDDLRALGPVDGVLLVHVLHHLDDEQVRALGRRLRDVLRPTGRILVVDPYGVPHEGQPPTHLVMRRLDLGSFHRKPEWSARLLGLKVDRWERLRGSLLFAGYWATGVLAPRAQVRSSPAGGRTGLSEPAAPSPRGTRAPGRPR